MICTNCGSLITNCGAPHSEEIKVQYECDCGNIECEYYSAEELEAIHAVEKASAYLEVVPDIKHDILVRLSGAELVNLVCILAGREYVQPIVQNVYNKLMENLSNQCTEAEIDHLFEDVRDSKPIEIDHTTGKVF